MITLANKNDHEILTNLTKLSKAYWKYSAAQLEKWADELTVTPDYIASRQVFKFCLNESIVGYYAYFYTNISIVKLDNLFVHPDYIGKGYGKILFLDFMERVSKEKATKVTLDSEPNAEEFYRKFGFEVVGQLATSIPGRYMPIMEKQLS